jgi:hypothetical protein
MAEATGIPPPDLKCTLIALSNPKNKILDKEPASKNLDETDVFTTNTKFKSKLYRVKVIAVAQKETEGEAVQTRQKVDEDRKHQYLIPLNPILLNPILLNPILSNLILLNLIFLNLVFSNLILSTSHVLHCSV